MNASSSPRRPIPFVALPDEDRGEDGFLDALAEAGLELRVADLLALEILGEHLVVGFGGRFQELVAASGDLGVHVRRDRDLDLLPTVPLPGAPMDQVDVPAERLGRPDGQLERCDLRPEGGSQRIERRRRVGVLAVALVDEEAGRAAPRSRLCDRRLQARLDPARRVDDEQRPVAGGHRRDDLGDEVRVAGRVHHRDDRPVVVEGRHGRAERLLAPMLLRLVVEGRRPVVDLARGGRSRRS